MKKSTYLQHLYKRITGKMSKRALLIGINYRGTNNELAGCINDITNVKNMLLNNGYKEADIVILTDDTEVKPTRANILREILNLIVSPSDILYLHYSGHGSNVLDKDGSETDKRDETLVPVDYEDAGLILDDEIRGLLECLDESKKMFCVLDCCHSGSGMDLSYSLCNVVGKPNKYVMSPNDTYKKTRGKVVMLSGCLDEQTSADAIEENLNQGALTYAYLKTLKNKGASVTYEQLIVGIRDVLIAKKYEQIPTLSSGRSLSLSTKIFI
jgi:metacaspase-1